MGMIGQETCSEGSCLLGILGVPGSSSGKLWGHTGIVNNINSHY